jgi:hypothetical protein
MNLTVPFSVAQVPRCLVHKPLILMPQIMDTVPFQIDYGTDTTATLKLGHSSTIANEINNLARPATSGAGTRTGTATHASEALQRNQCLMRLIRCLRQAAEAPVDPPEAPDRDPPEAPDRDPPEAPDRDPPEAPDRDPPEAPDRDPPEAPDRDPPEAPVDPPEAPDRDLLEAVRRRAPAVRTRRRRGAGDGALPVDIGRTSEPRGEPLRTRCAVLTHYRRSTSSVTLGQRIRDALAAGHSVAEICAELGVSAPTIGEVIDAQRRHEAAAERIAAFERLRAAEPSPSSQSGVNQS